MEQTVLERVRAVVASMQRGDVTVKDGMAEIERLVASMNWEDSTTKDYLDKIASEFTWIVNRTANPERQKLYTDLVEAAGSQFALVKRGIVEEVRRNILPVLKKGGSVKELEAAAKNNENRRRRYFSTIARTAASAFDSAGTIFDAQDAGFEWFRYMGPNAERKFCVDRLGRVFHISEILAMDNGHKLSPWLYKGGWNCRHYWSPVPEFTARQERPEWFTGRLAS